MMLFGHMFNDMSGHMEPGLVRLISAQLLTTGQLSTQ